MVCGLSAGCGGSIPLAVCEDRNWAKASPEEETSCLLGNVAVDTALVLSPCSFHTDQSCSARKKASDSVLWSCALFPKCLHSAFEIAQALYAMAILGHHSNSTVKVVFAHSLTLYLLVSKGIARTDILERHYMLLATFMNFFVSKLNTFENLWEEYNLLSIHIDDINLQVRNSVALKMLLGWSMTKCSFTAWALHHT